MLSLALPGRVFVCAIPTDMRKSFDGLSSVVRGSRVIHTDDTPVRVRERPSSRPRP